jgi:hypothetical protein
MNKHYIKFMLIFLALVAFIVVIPPFFTKRCQDKYGLVYNDIRRKLFIPIIPNNWGIKERDKVSVSWVGYNIKIGHKRKTVIFTGCDVESELDVYILPNENGTTRLLEMDYRYGQQNHKAVVIYTYQINDRAMVITQSKADSIFHAEKIEKDYGD